MKKFDAEDAKTPKKTTQKTHQKMPAPAHLQKLMQNGTMNGRSGTGGNGEMAKMDGIGKMDGAAKNGKNGKKNGRQTWLTSKRRSKTALVSTLKRRKKSATPRTMPMMQMTRKKTATLRHAVSHALRWYTTVAMSRHCQTTGCRRL